LLLGIDHRTLAIGRLIQSSRLRLEHTMAIDTHAYVKRLEKAGFTLEEAEGQLDALTTNILPDLPTKGDLELALAKLTTRLLLGTATVVGVIVGFADAILFFALKGGH
jgi:hypothetical protein